MACLVGDGDGQALQHLAEVRVHLAQEARWHQQGRVFVSMRDADKDRILPTIRMLVEEGFVATLAGRVDDHGGFAALDGDLLEDGFRGAGDEAAVEEVVERGVLGGLAGGLGADLDGHRAEHHADLAARAEIFRKNDYGRYLSTVLSEELPANRGG